MKPIVAWLLVVVVWVVPSKVLADHLQGHRVAPGATVQSGGEFYPEGEPLQALYKRLLEADAMGEQVLSLQRTVTLQEEQLKNFQERKDLTDIQRQDFEKLQQSYELHLTIYRDAVRVYLEIIAQMKEQVATLLTVNKALADQVKAKDRELFWTRLLGPLFLLVGALSGGAL